MFATSVFEPSTSCLIPLVSVGTEFMSDCVPAESWLAPALSDAAPVFNVSLFATNVFEPSTSCLIPDVSVGMLATRPFSPFTPSLSSAAPLTRPLVVIVS